MPIDKQKEIAKYRRLIAIVGVSALVVTLVAFLALLTYFTLLVAYFGSALVAVPFLLVLYRLDSRYGDLQFRDDL